MTRQPIPPLRTAPPLTRRLLAVALNGTVEDLLMLWLSTDFGEYERALHWCRTHHLIESHHPRMRVTERGRIVVAAWTSLEEQP